MNDRRAPRSDDDVPIIGDYSDAQNARLHAEAPSAREPEPPAAERARGDVRRRDERWMLDPSDLQRHARIARQLEAGRRPGKLRKFLWVAALAAIGFAVYWKFDALRGISVDFSELESFLGRDAPTTGAGARPSGGEQTALVETQAVAGIEAPTSRAETSSTAPRASGERPPAAPASGERPPAAPASGERPPAAPASAERPPVRREPPAQEDTAASTVAPGAGSDAEQVGVAPPVPPAPPPEPETFAFALPVNTVSESDAATAVLIVRSGDSRAASSVTWWTTPGTATAGADYVDQGRVVEKFAPGEQNRTIRIPIVGDNVVEGPETFYVHLARISGGEEVELGQTEVVINDDD